MSDWVASAPKPKPTFSSGFEGVSVLVLLVANTKAQVARLGCCVDSPGMAEQVLPPTHGLVQRSNRHRAAPAIG